MLSRRVFIGSASAFASIGYLRRPANAAEFSLKLGFDQPLNHPMTIRAQQAAEKAKEESGGRLEILVFPNNQLGGDSAMLTQVRSGAISMVLMSDGILSNVVPLAAIENVAFAFSNYKQAFGAMDGPLGAQMRAAIAKAGLFPFEKIWCSGFKQVVNSVRPLNGPKDFKGLKFRVPPSPMETALFRAVDASAVPINFAETYTAMQTHLVDGASLPIATVETSKFFEVQKYLTKTNHIFTGYSLIAHAPTWQQLPKELQEMTERHFNVAALLQRSDIIGLDEQAEAKLIGDGMQIAHVDVDSFRRAMHDAGFYTTWKTQFGNDAWTALQKSAGTLT
jgi:tripartite ATP-independent transporter DctP family solute receptor